MFWRNYGVYASPACVFDPAGLNLDAQRDEHNGTHFNAKYRAQQTHSHACICIDKRKTCRRVRVLRTSLLRLLTPCLKYPWAHLVPFSNTLSAKPVFVSTKCIILRVPVLQTKYHSSHQQGDCQHYQRSFGGTNIHLSAPSCISGSPSAIKSGSWCMSAVPFARPNIPRVLFSNGDILFGRLVKKPGCCRESSSVACREVWHATLHVRSSNRRNYRCTYSGNVRNRSIELSHRRVRTRPWALHLI